MSQGEAMTQEDVPDLTGAEVYAEAGDRPVAGGRWHVLPDRGDGTGDRVIYQRPDGRFELKAVVNAETLRSSPTWRRLPDQHG